MKQGYQLTGQAQYVPERELWMGVVAKIQNIEPKITMLASGCELTQEDALRWCAQTIKAMREANRLDVQAPDMYERAKIVQALH